MSPSLKTIFAALTMSAVASMAGAPAAAADEPVQVSISDSYADLNIAAPPRAHALLGPIHKAARQVCGEAYSHSRLTERDAIKCRNEKIASTVSTLDFPMLTLAWNGKYAAKVLAAR